MQPYKRGLHERASGTPSFRSKKAKCYKIFDQFTQTFMLWRKCHYIHWVRIIPLAPAPHLPTGLVKSDFQQCVSQHSEWSLQLAPFGLHSGEIARDSGTSSFRTKRAKIWKYLWSNYLDICIVFIWHFTFRKYYPNSKLHSDSNFREPLFRLLGKIFWYTYPSYSKVHMYNKPLHPCIHLRNLHESFRIFLWNQNY